MSENNRTDPYDPYEVPKDNDDEETPQIIPGGPLDCQDCGDSLGRKLAAGFSKKGEDGKIYIAGICPDCMVKRLGLEWREHKTPTLVVPQGSMS